jgi:GH24 family phage-related lysozyme (muramidase)
VPQATEVSRSGLLQIAQREAFVPVAYPDGWLDEAKTKPRWSIGFGDNSAKEGDTIDLPEALDRFKRAVAERTATVLRRVKVDLSQRQLDALVSLYYQGGNIKLAPVADLLNAGRYTDAAAQFLERSMATTKDGEYRKGLKTRREREYMIFTAADYGDIGWVWKYTSNPKFGRRERYDVKEDDL